MAERDALLKRKKTVQWKQVDRACSFMVEFDVDHEAVNVEMHDAPASDSSQATKTSNTCCFAFTDFLRDQVMGPQGKREIHGYLWKFRSTAEDMKDLGNWDRRFFFLRDHPLEGRIQVYFSEKEGGMHLACKLRQGPRNKHGPILDAPVLSELPQVRLCTISSEKVFDVQQQLQLYDIAFRTDDQSLCNPEEYADDVPTALFPWEVLWKEVKGHVTKDRRLVLAAARPSQREEWMRSMTMKQRLPSKVEENREDDLKEALAIAGSSIPYDMSRPLRCRSGGSLRARGVPGFW
eukprot:CAMPEP_0117499258 /NCGR_PEP_ID=MMETSP0784-20121206/22153_1 /TAXON_ID=39447 /ORGANISM="" /LENGTH=291 /DNA_ID=CAMNT_0005294401 /DNA_START=55 /DNA_END=928 /DNA_ORIENTATION=-